MIVLSDSEGEDRQVEDGVETVSEELIRGIKREREEPSEGPRTRARSRLAN